MSEQESIISKADKRIAINSVYMTIRLFVVMVISLFSTRIALKTLGVVDFGIFGVVAGFVSMFGFINNSLTSATQRFYNNELGRNGENGVINVYNASIRIHIIIALIVFLLSESVGTWYINNKMVIPIERLTSAKLVFQASIVSLIISILSTPFSAAIISYEHMNCYAVISIVDALLKLFLLLIIPLVNSDSLVIYGLTITFVSVVDLFLYVFMAQKHIPSLHIEPYNDTSLMKSMLCFSGWRLVDSLTYMFREQGLNMVLNVFYGPIVNAARSISYQINSASQSFLNSVINPIRPQLTQSFASGNVQRSLVLSDFMCKFSFYILYIISLPIIIETEFILKIWLGASIPDHAINFTRLLLISNLFGTCVFPICSLIQAIGKLEFYEITSSISNIITIPLAIFFISKWDCPEITFAALIITSITNTLVGIISVKRLINNFRISVFLRETMARWPGVIVISLPISLLPALILEDRLTCHLFNISFSFIISIFTTYYVGLNIKERFFIKQASVSLKGKIFNKLKIYRNASES